MLRCSEVCELNRVQNGLLFEILGCIGRVGVHAAVHAIETAVELHLRVSLA